MKTILILLSLLSFVAIAMNAQDMEDGEIPYHQIPDAPEDYSSGNVLARLVDGLGYRYYWATQSLNQEDMRYKPSDDARSLEETIDHIYGLSRTILNGVKNVPNVRPSEPEELDWQEKRAGALHNFKMASDLLRGKESGDVEEMKIVFQRGERKSEFPFWNMINGPIADAIYHTGQVVSFRRAAGNPIPKGVNVFTGKTRE